MTQILSLADILKNLARSPEKETKVQMLEPVIGRTFSITNAFSTKTFSTLHSKRSTWKLSNTYFVWRPCAPLMSQRKQACVPLKWKHWNESLTYEPYHVSTILMLHPRRSLKRFISELWIDDGTHSPRYESRATTRGHQLQLDSTSKADNQAGCETCFSANAIPSWTTGLTTWAVSHLDAVRNSVQY